MSYCRLCLTDFISLDDLNIQPIHEKIKTVFSFEITSHPDIPEHICPTCVNIISQFYDYFCLVHQNQLKLYCQIEDNQTNTECNERKEFQSNDYPSEVKKEIQIESPEVNCDMEYEPMEDDDASQDIIKMDEWLHEDGIKIEPNELMFDDSEVAVDKIYSDQPWKLENNCLYRQLEMVCDICQKVLFTYQMMESHIKKAHAKQCYIQCCEQTFTSEQISNHFEEHNPIVKLEEPSFDMEQNNGDINDSAGKSTNLIRNNSEDHSWKFEINIICRHLDMTCEICHRNQFTYPKLAAHLKDVHSRKCYITCCGLKLGGAQMLINHFENHWPNVKSIKTRYEYAKINIYEHVLKDFANALEGYERLPNMALAMQDHIIEKIKLNDVVDFLVDKYFPMDCQLCDTKCSNNAERRIHFSQSHPTERYFDSCCGARFSDRFNKMRHLNNHWKPIVRKAPPVAAVITKKTIPSNSERVSTIMEDFRGELEEAGFKTPASWTNEVSANELDYLRKMQDYLIAKYLPLNCELCDAKLSSYVERRDHLRNTHSMRQFYIECCDMKIYKRMQIFLHLWRHKKGLHLLAKHGYSHAIQAQQDSTIESFFKMDCRYCDFKGDSFKRLRSHVVNNHREEKFFITCCNIRLYRRYHILTHIANHQNPFVECEHCKEKFPNPKEHKDHIRSMHTNELIFKCDQCDEIFSDPKVLHEHEQKHNLSNCDICGIELNKYSLQRHRKTVHKLGEEIHCPECPKVFYYSSDYMAHRKRNHLNSKLPGNKKSARTPSEYNISCPLCPNMYTSQKGLKIHHQRSHVGKYKEKSIPKE